MAPSGKDTPDETVEPRTKDHSPRRGFKHETAGVSAIIRATMPVDPLLGATVSHYKILEQIGAGGMGVVYLAEDERLHRKVALKFISPASAGDTVAQRRLLREAQTASSLDNPNIATVYEVGDFEGQFFIAMAYYQGETLKGRIDRGTLPLAEVASIAWDIANGLAAAHTSGVVHRDRGPRTAGRAVAPGRPRPRGAVAPDFQDGHSRKRPSWSGNLVHPIRH